MDNKLNFILGDKLPFELDEGGDVCLLGLNVMVITLDNIEQSEQFLFDDGDLSFGVLDNKKGAVQLISQYRSKATNKVLTFAVYAENNKLDLDVLAELSEKGKRLLMKIVTVEKSTGKIVALRASTLAPHTQEQLRLAIEGQIKSGNVSICEDEWEALDIMDLAKTVDLRRVG